MTGELGLAVWLRLRDRPILVVGGGAVAAAKCAKLLGTGATITLVAPRVLPELATQAATGAIRWHARPFADADVAGQFLVIAATGAAGVDAAVFAACEARQIWCNSADIPAACSAFLMAQREVGAVCVAVGTGGAAPGLAGRIADQLTQALPKKLAGAVDNYAQLRRFVMQHTTTGPDRSAVLRWLAGLPWRQLAHPKTLTPTLVAAQIDEIARHSASSSAASVAKAADPR